MARPARVQGNNSNTVRISGTDRLAHVADASKIGDGKTVYKHAISAGSFPRLERVASAFQRIRYTRLHFKVVGLAASTTTGGLAIGFLPDPDDIDTSVDTSTLLASPGGVIAKAWETARVVGRCPPSLLFTSRIAREPRTYSPGVFAVIIEGSIGTSAPLSIYCDWSVELSVPALEAEQLITTDLVFAKAVYSRASNYGLWSSDQADQPWVAVPGIRVEQLYALPTPRYYDGTAMSGNFKFVKWTKDPTHGDTLWVCDMDGKPIIEESTATKSYFAFQGETLVPVLPPNLREGASPLGRSPSQLSLSSLEIL